MALKEAHDALPRHQKSSGMHRGGGLYLQGWCILHTNQEFFIVNQLASAKLCSIAWRLTIQFSLRLTADQANSLTIKKRFGYTTTRSLWANGTSHSCWVLSNLVLRENRTAWKVSCQSCDVVWMRHILPCKMIIPQKLPHNDTSSQLMALWLRSKTKGKVG